MSILLKPSLSASDSVLITATAAVAVRKSVFEVCGKDAKIKLDELLDLQASLFEQRDNTNDLKKIIELNIELDELYHQIEWLEVNYFKYL
jgi:hypothetical protein